MNMATRPTACVHKQDQAGWSATDDLDPGEVAALVLRLIPLYVLQGPVVNRAVADVRRGNVHRVDVVMAAPYLLVTPGLSIGGVLCGGRSNSPRNNKGWNVSGIGVVHGSYMQNW